MKKYRKNMKPAVGVMILYLLLTAGLWMFMYSYTVSGGRITGDSRPPGELSVSGDILKLRAADKSAEIDLSALSGSSDLYLAAYLISPDELRGELYALSRLTGLMP